MGGALGQEYLFLRILYTFLLTAEITCQVLSEPLNGQVMYSTTVTSEATYNTTATYSCDVGFGLSGGEEERECEGDGFSLEGMWSGDAPTCEGK